MLGIRTTGAAAIGVVIGAALLAGCGAGQITQTSTQVAAVNGANVTVGDIALRDAEITFPVGVPSSANAYTIGGSAPLELTIINTAGVPDKLVSASSPVASSVQVSGSADIPAGTAVVVGGKPVAAAATTSNGTRGSNTAPSATAAAAPAGARMAQVVLTGLRQDIRPGLAYEVVFTFQRAGEVHVIVPVANPAELRQAEHS